MSERPVRFYTPEETAAIVGNIGLDVGSQTPQQTPQQTPPNTAPTGPINFRTLSAEETAQMLPGLNTGRQSPQPRQTTRETLPTIDQAFVTNDPKRGASFGSELVASLAMDDSDRLKVYAAHLYPDLPINEALSNLRVVGSTGDIAYRGNDGNFYRLDPDAVDWFDTAREMGRGVVQWAGEIPYLPASAYGAARGAATGARFGPKGAIAGGIIGAGVGSGIVGAGRQAITNQVVDNDAGERVGSSAAYDAALSVAGDTVLRVAGRVVTKLFNQAGGIQAYQELKTKLAQWVQSPASQARKAELEQAIDSVNNFLRTNNKDAADINLNLAQLTNDPQLRAYMDRLSTNPSTARLVADDTAALAQQLNRVSDDVITSVSPPSSSFADADITIDNLARGIRREMGDDIASNFNPRFNALDAAASPVDLNPVVNQIDALLRSGDLTLSEEATIRSFLGNLYTDVPNPADPSKTIRVLVDDFHNARMRIANAFDELLADPSLRGSTKYALQGIESGPYQTPGIRGTFANQMEAASPGYLQTTKEYGEATIGRSRFTASDPSTKKLTNPTENLFNRGRPEDIARYRARATNTGNPQDLEDYNSAVATWLNSKRERAANTANANTPNNQVASVRNWLKMIAGNEKDWARVQAIVGQEVYTTLRSLQSITEAVNSNFYRNSSTAQQQQVMRILGAIVRPIRGALEYGGSLTDNVASQRMYEILRAPELKQNVNLMIRLISSNAAGGTRRSLTMAERAIAGGLDRPGYDLLDEHYFGDRSNDQAGR